MSQYLSTLNKESDESDHLQCILVAGQHVSNYTAAWQPDAQNNAKSVFTHVLTMVLDIGDNTPNSQEPPRLSPGSWYQRIPVATAALSPNHDRHTTISQLSGTPEISAAMIDQSAAIKGVAAAFLAVASIAVMLRCYVCLHTIKAFGWDDALMIASMLVYIMFCGCMIGGAIWGTGEHLIDLASK
ncbi:uncharacterized protein ACLA_094270 [Aspergillus clavatus NRRL 1]|uniref:Integral membrane protein n=1 Tax=Aspergillus clavatus (strain ATCC 1007 / CBS 513.65 / DSM 816 / NCTC 3887 / NRRL 1 / QM 1276 / 107) TaxID=344612 RepID=A1CFS8_ASPCL|nr:uncharacterized protein ACLA_094270 [Aspergillus clavatus NRRL 1]EAW11727.1 hypothetical protein ACLA_094270 [Aspergillus clavatus NRRL 1]